MAGVIIGRHYLYSTTYDTMEEAAACYDRYKLLFIQVFFVLPEKVYEEDDRYKLLFFQVLLSLPESPRRVKKLAREVRKGIKYARVSSMRGYQVCAEMMHEEKRTEAHCKYTSHSCLLAVSAG